MSKRSAGILLYRRTGGGLEVLLVHPGGPYWASKDDGAWSIPKGLYEDDEDPLTAARRELAEEIGYAAPEDEKRFAPLGDFKQPSGKIVTAWALEGDFDPDRLVSNTFTMEWPPGSGRVQEFPEVDRAAWLTPEVAMRKILKGQAPIVQALLDRLAPASAPAPRDNGRGSSS